MNRIEADAVLKNFNFSLKTKAFNSILFNAEKSKYNRYVTLLEKVLSKDEAEVYGIILLNSGLNNSFVNWGPGTQDIIGSMGRAERILDKRLTDSEIGDLINGLLYIVQQKTYDRWASALKAVKAKKIEIAEAAEFSKFLVESQALSTEIKDLTLAEIENILGYKVRIIS